MPDILEMPYIVWSPNQLSLAPTPGIEPGPLGLDLHWSMPDIFQMPDIVWCLTHWAIEFAIDFNIRNGKILYSRYSLASVFEQAMRTLQNSKALAGNISMLYHWLWVTVGLWDHMYKPTTYSKKFLQGVLKVLTISDNMFEITTQYIWYTLKEIIKN